MIYYYLVEENERYVIYKYYLEGREDFDHGIIQIDKYAGKIDLVALSEDDREYFDDGNETYSTFYADHVMRRINQECSTGEVKESGIIELN